MTYRDNQYSITTVSVPLWRRIGLWLNPQRWRLARAARGGHWVLYTHSHTEEFREILWNKVFRGREWIQTEPCNGIATEHLVRHDSNGWVWSSVAHEDHGEVWRNRPLTGSDCNASGSR